MSSRALALLTTLLLGACSTRVHLLGQDAGPIDPPGITGPDVDLAGANVRFIGTSNGYAGIDVDFVGDVDGDGLEDLVISDRHYMPPGAEPNLAVYLVYGRAGLSGDFPLADADATFVADHYFIENDFTAARAGDVDGDGYDDFLFSGTHLVWGGPVRYSGVLAASSVGTTFTGSLSAGDPVAPGGDLDGDGRDDVLVGDWLPERDGVGTGTVYVFYGRTDRFGGAIDLARADAIITRGEDADRLFGRSVTAAGDIDADGYADVVIGDQGFSAPGVVYLLYGGPARWSGSITTASAARFEYSAEVRDELGIRVAAVGDVDADGFDDFVIGDPYTPPSRVYLTYGRAYRFTGTFDLAMADFTFEGDAHDTNLGAGVAGGGDVNADGFADLLLGSPNSPDETQHGHSYVLYGGVRRLYGVIDTITYDMRLTGVIDGDNGTDLAGYAVANDGDFDGDGHADVIIGATGNRIGDDYGGRAYLVYGR